MSEGCFAESYALAKQLFLSAARQVQDVELHSLTVVDSYTMDIAIVPGTLDRTVVVSSGTHGVEGFAGSAIQIAILRRLAQQRVSPTVVLVHAVNPFGMAHFRRVNENNVDLNRNALHPHHFDMLRRQDTLEKTYMKFDHLFNPKVAPGLVSRLAFPVQTLSALLQHGALAIKTALVAATYTQSRGVFFGGHELQASHELLRDFMRSRFAQVRGDSVAWIDVHTGLGASGVDVLLGCEEDAAEMADLFPAAPGFDGFQANIKSGSLDAAVAKRCSKAAVETSQEMSQAAGYEHTVGFLGTEWVQGFFKLDTGRPLCFAQEFGTLPGFLVARALIMENAGFHSDRAHHSFWQSYTRDAFYVRTEDWKRRVLRRGLDVFGKIVCRQADSVSHTRSRL